MNKNGKIYVAGHNGLVGSAIVKVLQSKGYTNFVFRTFEELDLTNQQVVTDFFAAEKPEYVFLAAAKVGGIVANNTYRAQFIYENLMIQNNVIHQAYVHGVKKLLFLGSTCIYPKMAPQPMKEEDLLTGVLEETNEPYAIAKIAGLKMCENYNRQYGTNFMSVMPTNLYGPNDNFDLEKSHVLPALLRKIHLGKCLEDGDWDAVRKDMDKNPVKGIAGVKGRKGEGEILKVLGEFGIKMSSPSPALDDNSYTPPSPALREETPPSPALPQGGGPPSPALPPSGGREGASNGVSVEIWGSGAPLREFMYSEEMAAACVHVMESEKAVEMVKENPQHSWINIGSGDEISIKGLAELIKEKLGFKGELVFNADKPDGTPRKLTDIGRLSSLGFKREIDLEKGIELMYDAYIN